MKAERATSTGCCQDRETRPDCIPRCRASILQMPAFGSKPPASQVRPYITARSTLLITSTTKLTAAAATNDRSILSIVIPKSASRVSPWHRRAYAMSVICLSEIARLGV